MILCSHITWLCPGSMDIIIDYVNFQFYAYEKGTTIPQFIRYFETQSNNYKGGKV